MGDEHDEDGGLAVDVDQLLMRLDADDEHDDSFEDALQKFAPDAAARAAADEDDYGVGAAVVVVGGGADDDVVGVVVAVAVNGGCGEGDGLRLLIGDAMLLLPPLQRNDENDLKAQT